VKKGNEESIKSAADLKGKKVGVGLGTNYEEWLRANVQGVDIRTYDDDPTKYQDLRVGRIDAILVDRLAALDLVKKPTIRWPLRGCFLTSGSGCRIA
jgi:cystine transport system substrate-binding protein